MNSCPSHAHSAVLLRMIPLSRSLAFILSSKYFLNMSKKVKQAICPQFGRTGRWRNNWTHHIFMTIYRSARLQWHRLRWYFTYSDSYGNSQTITNKDHLLTVTNFAYSNTFFNIFGPTTNDSDSNFNYFNRLCWSQEACMRTLKDQQTINLTQWQTQNVNLYLKCLVTLGYSGTFPLSQGCHCKWVGLKVSDIVTSCQPWHAFVIG